MKTIYYILIFFLSNATITLGQNNSINTVSGKTYSTTEVIGKNEYSASLVFNKSKREALITILESYFDEVQKANKKITWKKLKGEHSTKAVFFVELKNKELKIEGKNSEEPLSPSVLEKLQKIYKEVVEVIQ